MFEIIVIEHFSKPDRHTFVSHCWLRPRAGKQLLKRIELVIAVGHSPWFSHSATHR